MRRWRRFLAWIDRDIGEQGWPSTNSLASNVPVLPYVLVLPPLGISIRPQRSAIGSLAPPRLRWPFCSAFGDGVCF